jgi:hypothetical protein
MGTNTSRLTTSFSDLQYELGTSVFPSNQQVHAYLQSYVTQFELDSHLRLGTQIKQIRCATDNGWTITFVTQAGELQTESFPYVVIAFFAEEVITFGAVPSPQLKPEQQAQLKALAAISNNSDLARIINQVELTEPASS